ncbi:MAG: hypothetical protein U0271_09825 [Polyangiaceae bacterium]
MGNAKRGWDMRRLSHLVVGCLSLVACEADSAAHATIEGIPYSVRLPPDLTLQIVDEQHHRWEKSTRDGWVVVIETSTSTRGPCSEWKPTHGGSRQQDRDGVMRERSRSTSYCFADGTRHLRCAAWHRRGYLNDDEVETARDICDSFQPKHE